MGMTNDRWDELVRQLDVKAATDPRAYKRSVALWAVGGYAVLVGALLLAAGAVVGVGLAVIAGGSGLLVKLAIPAFALALMIARALSVKLPPPEGIELSPADAPGLFEAIERLRERLGAPRLDHVLLDGDFNASIVQIPRLGPLGWQRNYLTVGLPFMQALSPKEFSSVLAHELGHIGGKHGHFSAWIYRLRSTWVRVMEELDQGHHVGAGLLRRFFDWYVPRFAAHSFALARAHEYEADAAAAEAVGARHASFALARSAVSAAAADRYWSGLYRRSNHEPTPPGAAFSGLLAELPAAPDEDGVRALDRALAEATDTADTHPSLHDRLAALGCSVDQLRGKALAPPEATAAAEMLSPVALSALAPRLDTEWHEEIRHPWAERHAWAREQLGKLERLETEAGEGPLPLQRAVERASLTEELHGRAPAVSRWREVLAVEPGHPRANMAVGAHLLSQDDETGLEHLERASEADPALKPYAAGLAHSFEAARGRSEEAARHRSTVNAHLDVIEAATDERRGLSRKDQLEPHGLSPTALGELREQLMNADRVATAYLARKQVEHLADDAPLYVLGIVPATKWWRLEGIRTDQRMLEHVVETVELPGELLAVPLVSENRWLRKRLEGVGEALVFAR
jgi:Zn-dependent protease with chaperone function